MQKKKIYNIVAKKMPAPNGRFGASGGVARPTLECRTATSALVQAFVIPPPAAKPLGRCTSATRALSRKYSVMRGEYNPTMQLTKTENDRLKVK